MKRSPPQALLYVPPKMTKTEVREYLTKIYNVKVVAVMTANFLGERLRITVDVCNSVESNLVSWQQFTHQSTKNANCRKMEKVLQQKKDFIL